MPIDWEQQLMSATFSTAANEEVVPELAESTVPVVVIAEAQINGSELIGEQGQASPLVIADVPFINGVNGVDHPDLSMTSEPQVSPAAPPPPPAPAPTKFHDMDLEKMHYKLYYIGYLTPQEFLDDLGKIVKNAENESHEDHERLFKAQSMVNTARLMLQGWEPQFRGECERMAVREMERRLERRRTRAAEKEAAKAKEIEEGKKTSAEGRKAGSSGSDEPPAHSYGTRRATRHNGVQPEVVDDPVDIERRLKRQRSEVTRESAEPLSAGANGATESELLDPDRAAKRARTTPKPDGSPVDAPASLSGTDHAQELCVTPQQDTDTPRGVLSVSELTGEPSAMDLSMDAGVPAEGSSHLTEEPSAPPLPVFHIDEARVIALQEHLVHSTSSLTVEQLEQLRALCLSCIWRNRGEWDRDSMIGQLMEIVTDFVQQVQQVGVGF